MNKEYLCLKEVAELLGINVKTAKVILQDEEIHYTRVRRKILVKKSDLIDYMARTDNIKIIS